MKGKHQYEFLRILMPFACSVFSYNMYCSLVYNVLMLKYNTQIYCNIKKKCFTPKILNTCQQT